MPSEIKEHISFSASILRSEYQVETRVRQTAVGVSGLREQGRLSEHGVVHPRLSRSLPSRSRRVCPLHGMAFTATM